ncbi:MAG TPA: ATP-binding protein [Syntrophomonadaceae bacterium]|nr:ATP-binding protein [Syntrophomonadaceae bacterium]
MKIAVLSGKGGTGKTLLSVNMAAVADNSKYIDCDVEEPNGHLFLKPKEITSKDVTVKIPVVDENLCDGSRVCVDFCKFNALAYINDKLYVFDDLCHSCGGCILLCPKKALTEKDVAIGKIERGISEGVEVVTGILDPGEISGVPIIDDILKEDLKAGKINFIDCPPGTACIVMDSIKDADYCVLVAEPTLFGVHNLAMVYELVKVFEKPHGVVLNKCLNEQNPAEEFCIENEIKILGKINYDEELGTLNSNALIAARESEKYKKLFSDLLQNVTKEVQNERIINS